MGSYYLLDMINKIKYNESLRRKKNVFKDNRDAYLKVSNREAVFFKTATKEQLAEIRTKVIEERKKESKKRIFILIISIPIAAICVYLIAEYFSLWLQRRF